MPSAAVLGSTGDRGARDTSGSAVGAAYWTAVVFDSKIEANRCATALPGMSVVIF
jgi:hypothetical protein